MNETLNFFVNILYSFSKLKKNFNQKFLLILSGTKRKLCLTAEQFETFLNKEQRDPGLNELLYPNYTVEKAMELINKFEIEDSFKKKSICLFFIKFNLFFIKLFIKFN